MRYQAALHSDGFLIPTLAIFQAFFACKTSFILFFPDQRWRIIGQPAARVTAHLVARQI